MDRKKWMQVGVSAVLLIALVLGILALAGVFAPAKVGLCLPQREGAWDAYYDLLEDNLLAAEYQVERCTVNADPAAQTQQVRSMLDRGFRHFVIQPVDAANTAELLRILQEAGAKVVFINEQPEKLAEYTAFSFVGFDPVMAGQLQAQLVLNSAELADHNGDGVLSYAVLDTHGNTPRQRSCAAALEDGVCLEVQVCSMDAESAKQRCTLLLSHYGKDMEIVFCANDVLTMGALEAIEDGGRKVGEDIFLIGADATAQSLELVKQGALSATLIGDMQEAAQQVLQLLDSREQVIYQAAYMPVTQENVTDYIK